MSVIKPSVGRVVWFHAAPPDIFPGSGETCAAIVAHVHGDRMVNLCVIDGNGDTRPRTSVPLLQPGDPVPSGQMYCEWMPFQVGQAQKAEALAKELDAKCRPAE